MKNFKALVLAHYDFTNKEGRAINTTKLLISLGEYGTITLCSELANDFDILEEINVSLGYKNNKFVVNSVE